MRGRELVYRPEGLALGYLVRTPLWNEAGQNEKTARQGSIPGAAQIMHVAPFMPRRLNLVNLCPTTLPICNLHRAMSQSPLQLPAVYLSIQPRSQPRQAPVRHRPHCPPPRRNDALEAP